MRRNLSFAMALIAASSIPGCALPEWRTAEAYEASHIMDVSHPVHGYPAQVGYYTGAVVGTVALGPFALLEGFISERDIMHRQDGPFHYATAHLAGGCSWVLGGPFYLLSLPFERERDPAEDPPPPAPQVESPGAR